MIGIVCLYVLVGLFTGLVSGMLGIGGGVVVVPALLFIFTHDTQINPSIAMHLAIGSSLAIMIFTAHASLRAHHKRGTILWPVYKRMAAGIIGGTILGGLLSDIIPTDALKIFLGIVLLFVAMTMLFTGARERISPARFPAPVFHHLIGIFIGFQSGLLGIGGGALLIPYLAYCGVGLKNITAISVLCTMTVAVIGTIIYLFTGFNEPDLPRYSIGFVYWPAVVCVSVVSHFVAPSAAALAYRLPIKWLNFGFVIVLLLTSINLLL